MVLNSLVSLLHKVMGYYKVQTKYDKQKKQEKNYNFFCFSQLTPFITFPILLPSFHFFFSSLLVPLIYFYKALHLFLLLLFLFFSLPTRTFHRRLSVPLSPSSLSSNIFHSTLSHLLGTFHAQCDISTPKKHLRNHFCQNPLTHQKCLHH